jgi:hypothetical protein
MNRRGFFIGRMIAMLIFVGLLLGGGYTAYRVGINQGYVLGAQESGLEPAEIAPQAQAFPQPHGRYGYGYGFSPFFWGFGFFFKCLFGLFIFMMFSKIFFWGFGGRRWGRHGHWKHKHWKHDQDEGQDQAQDIPDGIDS